MAYPVLSRIGGGLKGMLITMEGVEGSGKSTQIQRLAERLGQAGLSPVVSKEPGGTSLGRELRRLLLTPRTDGESWCAKAELLLFYADRAQHLATLVHPALEQGKVVLVDRFEDSSWAYQGAQGVPEADLVRLRDVVLGEFRPDLTLVLDMDPEESLRRVGARNAQLGEAFTETRYRPGGPGLPPQGPAALPGDRRPGTRPGGAGASPGRRGGRGSSDLVPGLGLPDPARLPGGLMFDPAIKGHGALRQRLLDRLQGGRLPGSLLFTGPDGIGKRRVAMELAQRELCFRRNACGSCAGCQPFRADPVPVELPNLLRIAPEGKAGLIRISAIREDDLVEGGVIRWAHQAAPPRLPSVDPRGGCPSSERSFSQHAAEDPRGAAARDPLPAGHPPARGHAADHPLPVRAAPVRSPAGRARPGRWPERRAGKPGTGLAGRPFPPARSAIWRRVPSPGPSPRWMLGWPWQEAGSSRKPVVPCCRKRTP